MGDYTITQTDDGKHAIRDAEGRVATVTVNPDTGARSTANGFDTQADAQTAAKASGLEVSSRKPQASGDRKRPARTGGGAAKAAKRSGARRS